MHLLSSATAVLNFGSLFWFVKKFVVKNVKQNEKKRGEKDSGKKNVLGQH